ncbi:SphA family protein [Marinobacterium nitratireducens]|nr:transporter [Marinobacterium nitratireducens]
MLNRFATTVLPLGLGALGALVAAPPALAVEGATGMYILGSRTTAGGVVPPPGNYFQQSLYVYSGSADAGIPRSGGVDVGLDADAYVGLTSFLAVPEMAPILGGRAYFSGTLVYGYKDLDIGATLRTPGGATISGSRSEDDFLFGDPVVGTGLGWGAGPWFGSLNLLVNLPVGDYEKGRPTNVSFNRWATDVTGALTWLDQASGWQADIAMGITFNGENEDTNYESGDEFHIELAAARSFASGWTLGLQGYHYDQISADKGGAAVLGDFEGEVSGFGPAVAWAGPVGGRPINLEARYFHEFDAKNRLEGDALLLNLTIPL